MRRTLYLIYGVTAYLSFLGIAFYLQAFFANFMVIKSIDQPSGPRLTQAMAVDVMLILLFGLQHSIMARPGFKKWLTRIVPEPIERSTYLFASVAALVVLVWQWRPISQPIWNIEQPFVRGLIWGLFMIGWAMVPVISLMINHFDLFGLRQVWLYFQGKPYEPLAFRTPWFYSRVRHPLYVAWAVAFWATPTMSIGHALLAAGLTTYMLIAVVFEEADLVNHFGSKYAEYKRRVPAFVPRMKMSSDSFELSRLN